MATGKTATPAAKTEKAEKVSVFRKQVNYDGTVEDVDTAIYSVEIACKDKTDGKQCEQTRYVKPQDKFQVKFCKPHAKKHSRKNASKKKKVAAKARTTPAKVEAAPAAAS